MTIGCLGDVVFSVSDETLKTISNMKWSGSAKYATHQRHATSALTEFTGLDADKLSFSVYLSAFYGVDPQKEVTKIWNYERSGTAVPLVIGDKAYGKYRWVIQNHSFQPQAYDRRGNVLTATMSLSLLEYLRE